MPAPFVIEERKLTKKLKKLDGVLQQGSDHETSIDSAEKKLQEYISDEVAWVATEAKFARQSS